MDLNEFINNFAEQFDDTDKSKFKADTLFHDLDEWSSMTALSIIGMVDEKYGLTIKGDDIRSSETIEDLFGKVQGKK
jgi:acyl carrier protein